MAVQRSWLHRFWLPECLGRMGLAALVSVSLLNLGGECFAQARRPNRPAANRPAPKEELPDPETRDIHIAKVDATALEARLAAAAKIDQMVERNYIKHGVEPNPPLTDEQFVRRAYLDITGAIPSFQDASRFIYTRDSQKRARLIDELLNSRGYASHHFNYWGDILRLTDRLNNNVSGEPFNEWVKKSLEENKPYDKFVYEMMTASGKPWDNPATGYILRDADMPLDAINNTVRVFLGTQIGCAQCHNHPFDRWTQKEFYQLAAFMYPTRDRIPYRGGKDKVNHYQRLTDEMKQIDSSYLGGGQFARFLRANTYAVWDTKRPLRLPHDYAYDDAAPEDLVKPITIFGPQAPLSASSTPREAFASWMTSPDNPRFAMTIANRMWKKCFGIGLIEPEDDIKDDTVAENPELMQFLTDEMIRLNFDLKEFLRILHNTQTYQRQASVAEVMPGEEYHFPGPILRRMSAEQVWDSFITLATFDPNVYQRRPAHIEADLYNVDLETATAKEIVDRQEQLREATRGKVERNRDKDHKYENLLLVRASELPLPAPPDHFLRQFGQSDRELIQVSSTDGSVPQVLQMFNGSVTHMLLEGGSLMHHNVTSKSREDARIDVIFLSVLSRKPNDEERDVAKAEIDERGPAGYGNVIWALVNTREFLFIQ